MRKVTINSNMTAKYNDIITEEAKELYKGVFTEDDISRIIRLIDDLVFDDETVDYTDLIFDLQEIANRIWGEFHHYHGLTQEWEDTVIEIVNTFNDKNRYVRNEHNLRKLINIINSHRAKINFTI